VSDFVTVLYAPERLTKKFTGPDYVKNDFDQSLMWFEAITVAVEDIHGLSGILTELEDVANACIVRAELVPGADPKSVNRRKHDHQDGIVPSMRMCAQGHHWVMFDFDKVPVTGLDTMEERLAHLIEMLPPAFHDASFHYQWSSSAGMDGWQTLSAHLWYWLREPWTDDLLIERIEDQQWDIDECTIRTVQPNYTARPLFEDCSDPLVERSGFIRGSRDEVVLQPWIRPAMRTFRGALIPLKRSANKTFEERLADIGPRYHMPINRAIASYLKCTPDPDLEYLKTRVRDAIEAGPTGSTPKRIYLRDAYLNASIAGARRKFG
jgi:hypothetical protein